MTLFTKGRSNLTRFSRKEFAFLFVCQISHFFNGFNRDLIHYIMRYIESFSLIEIVKYKLKDVILAKMKELRKGGEV